MNPINTVFASKRLIGRKFSDQAIKEYAKHVPYHIVSASNGDAWVKANNKIYSP
jgi:molecular chaperone DnaK